MNKDQLKHSLNELSPSDDQKRQMLRNIRQKREPKRGRLGLKLASIMAVMVFLFGLAKVLPSFAPTAPETMAMGAPEATRSATAEAMEMNTKKSLNVAWKNYDEELKATPWNENFSGSLPIFSKQSDIVSSAQAPAEEASAMMVSEADELVAYAYGGALAEHGYVETDRVPILTLEEATAKVVALGIKKSDILDGFLSYTPLETEETELRPMYRFRYTQEGEIHYLTVDATR